MNAPQHPFGGDPEGHPLLLLIRVETDRQNRIRVAIQRSVRTNYIVLGLVLATTAINVGFGLIMLWVRHGQ